jgi:molybdopterin-guanine dinucleotide biosynthesis protein A
VKPSAAILSGGHARRFGGCDKGALVVDGRTIRARQIAELAAIAGEIMIVGARTPSAHEYGALPPDVSVREIADRMPDCGPLGGLHSALLEAAGEPTIVVACDMPFVSERLLRHLLTLAGEADVVVPHTDRGYHPLCAVYARACIEPVARRLAARRLKMIDLFEDVRVRVVAARELSAFGDLHRLLANVNSPADHRELEALQGHQL